MIGKVIKWRIKIVNKKGGMMFGVGLRNVLVDNDFIVSGWNNYN